MATMNFPNGLREFRGVSSGLRASGKPISAWFAPPSGIAVWRRSWDRVNVARRRWPGSSLPVRYAPGAEIDLVLFGQGRRIGVECKRADAPS